MLNGIMQDYFSSIELLNAFFHQNLKQLMYKYSSLKKAQVVNKILLFRQGERCEHVWWITDGIVKLSHLTEQGSEITVALMKQGDVIGSLHEHFNQSVMMETAQTLGEVNSLRLSYNDFKMMLSDYPALAWWVIGRNYIHQQNVKRKLCAILTQSVEVRVAETLLELASVFGSRCAHGYVLEIYLTQQQVADLAGASRPVVSTILNNFRNHGMLNYTRDQICINDAALYDFCHAK